MIHHLLNRRDGVLHDDDNVSHLLNKKEKIAKGTVDFDCFNLSAYCVTRAPLLYFIRSWVALSFKVVSESVSQWGIGNTCPDLHFVQYIKA